MIPIGGRRRNASVDSSFSEGNRSSGKFSIALTQALGEQEQKMDLLASRRESLAAVDSVKRPIIGFDLLLMFNHTALHLCYMCI